MASTGTPTLVDGFDRASGVQMGEVAEWTLDISFARTGAAGGATG